MKKNSVIVPSGDNLIHLAVHESQPRGELVSRLGTLRRKIKDMGIDSPGDLERVPDEIMSEMSEVMMSPEIVPEIEKSLEWEYKHGHNYTGENEYYLEEILDAVKKFRNAVGSGDQDAMHDAVYGTLWL